MTAHFVIDHSGMRRRWRAVRQRSEALAAPLSAEDQVIQSMPDASPTKWHLAHVTWFFETVVLAAHAPGYRPFDDRFAFLFNSYYEALGPRHPRPRRGLLSRPDLDTVLAWRRHVDAAMEDFIDSADADAWTAAAPVVELGLHHEEQHQELLLTDIRHALWCNPLAPAYDPAWQNNEPCGPLEWVEHPGGLVEIGAGTAGFAYDNERPRHRRWLEPFRLASRPVTCGEYLAFMADGGYARPEFWLSDGWALAQAEGWRAPLYWQDDSGAWQVFGLGGLRPVSPKAPVTNVSFFEAAAYAAWAGARLPTEAEWEVLAVESAAVRGSVGQVWEWTRSAYDPYPGFRPLSGALGEYNGKFMAAQMVLRGGSRLSPPGPMRPTYRNFFYPTARWQDSGIRLAEDAS